MRGFFYARFTCIACRRHISNLSVAKIYRTAQVSCISNVEDIYRRDFFLLIPSIRVSHTVEFDLPFSRFFSDLTKAPKHLSLCKHREIYLGAFVLLCS